MRKKHITYMNDFLLN